MRTLRKTLRAATPIALIATVGTLANAAPSVDGQRDTEYGSSVSNQVSSVIDIVTGVDAQLTATFDNSNIGGVAGAGSGPFTVFPDPISPPGDVTTGIEFSITLDELAGDGSDPIKIGGFIHQGLGQDRGFVSNQVIGLPDAGTDESRQPLGNPADNSGNPIDPPVVDFTTISGDQFVTAETLMGTAPVVDGTLDASYGAPLYVNTIASTGFDNLDPDSAFADGSEFNAVYAVTDGTTLYVMVTGNIRSNPPFQEKVSFFIDSDPAVGQNTLDDGGFGGTGFDLIAEFNGIVWDANFVPDYFLSFNGDENRFFLDVQELPASAGGDFTYASAPTGDLITADANTPTDNPAQFGGPTPNGGTIQIIADNSNVGGVAGAIQQAEPDSPPADVMTGFEFKIPASDLGIPMGATEFKVSGLIVSGDLGFASNQTITALPGATGNIAGGGAQGISNRGFDDFAGDQFLTVNIPASLPTANIVIDGSAMGESQYLDGSSFPYINDDVATGFGNNTSDDPIVTADGGSEINNASFFIAEDPDNNNEPTVYGFVGGNLETNNNKLLLFFDADTTPGVGQNPIRDDNDAGFEFGNFNSNVGGDGYMDPMSDAPGFTFDAGFEPDFVIVYNGTATERFAGGMFLPTNGGGFGGQFFADAQPSGLTAGDPVPPATGTLEQFEGFGDNDDPDSVTANGSELNNLTAVVDETFTFAQTRYLYLHLGGNISTDGTVIEVFVDADPARGQDTLIYDDPDNPDDFGNPDVAFGALNRMGGPATFMDDMGNPFTQPGFTFDNGFTADYYYTFNFSDGGWFGDYARLRDVLPEDPDNPGEVDPGTVRNLGKYGPAGSSNGFSDGSGSTTSELVLFTVDNSNIAGVAGADDQFGDTSGAPAVTTGIEIAIPVEDLNLDLDTPGDSVKVTVFVNGSGHADVSNQFIGAACTDELGEPRNVNLQNLDGPQFVELVYNGTDGVALTNNAPAEPDCEPAPDCPGDTDGDNLVGLDDLLTVLGNFGNNVAGGPADGDVDPIGAPDGLVGLDDLLLVLGNFGNMCM